MRQASLRVLAAGWALVVLAGGCTIGPDWLNPWSMLSRRENSPIGVSPPKDHGKVAFSTPADPTSDPVSLANEATPSADLHVATARLSERSGKVAEAERQYEKALALDPGHVDALVGLARLKDRQGQLDEATRLYRQGTQAHADNASLLNDLGLCLARQRKYREAIKALDRAIALEPKKWLYRNNMAMVLVETGDVQGAVSHLKAVQGESVAHYNVGYILQKKGDSDAAAQHFAIALAQNPSLGEARIWLEKLGREPASLARSAPLVASERPLGAGSANLTDRPGGPGPADPPALRLLGPAPSQLQGPGAARPALERLPPVTDASGAGAPPLGPPTAFDSRIAPLPPPSSIYPANPGGNPGQGRVPAVLPLPPVNAAQAYPRFP